MPTCPHLFHHSHTTTITQFPLHHHHYSTITITSSSHIITLAYPLPHHHYPLSPPYLHTDISMPIHPHTTTIAFTIVIMHAIALTQSPFHDCICIITLAPFSSHNYYCIITILQSYHPIITAHTCIIAITSSHQYSHIPNPTCQSPLHSHPHTIIVVFAIIITHAIALMQSCLCNHICAITLAKFPLLHSHQYIITTHPSSLNCTHITTTLIHIHTITITHLHLHNHNHIIALTYPCLHTCTYPTAPTQSPSHTITSS